MRSFSLPAGAIACRHRSRRKRGGEGRRGRPGAGAEGGRRARPEGGRRGRPGKEGCRAVPQEQASPRDQWSPPPAMAMAMRRGRSGAAAPGNFARASEPTRPSRLQRPSQEAEEHFQILRAHAPRALHVLLGFRWEREAAPSRCDRSKTRGGPARAARSSPPRPAAPRRGCLRAAPASTGCPSCRGRPAVEGAAPRAPRAEMWRGRRAGRCRRPPPEEPSARHWQCASREAEPRV